LMDRAGQREVPGFVSQAVTGLRPVPVDGALTLRRPIAEPAPLRPLTRDEFTASGATLHFVRDGAGALSGFVLDVGRVRNLRFVRMPS
jgi:hypothetical protein